MKTIVLVIQQGFSARILLQTEVLNTLLESGARVVVLTSDPATMERYLQSRGLSQVLVEQLDIARYQEQQKGRLGHLFRQVRRYAVNVKTVDDIFDMDWKDARARGNPRGLLVLALGWLVAQLMRSNALMMKTVVNLENRLDAPQVHDAFFEKYRPDVVVLTSMGVFDYDHYVIREAKRHGVRVISYVLSWDNTSVRGLGVNLSDQIIVWSDVMKDELVELHRIPAEMIAVAGVPHYDFYVNGQAHIMGKDELAKEFGFDPTRRLLFLGTKSPNAFLYNADIARVICEAIRDGRLPEDCHLIVRLHPIYFRRRNGQYVFEEDLIEWEELLALYGADCLSVDYPSIEDGRLNLFMPDSEIPKLASILKNSDVVVNMFSTLNVEASIFDKPTVNVAFQFDHKRPPGTKIARFNIYYDEIQTHNQRVIRSNGTTVAHSVEQLIEQINQYLQNPHLHAAGRKQIVANECGGNLGRAGRAVGQTILRVAADETRVGA